MGFCYQREADSFSACSLKLCFCKSCGDYHKYPFFMSVFRLGALNKSTQEYLHFYCVQVVMPVIKPGSNANCQPLMKMDQMNIKNKHAPVHDLFFATCESLFEVFIFIKIFYLFTKDFKQGMPFCNQISHRLSWLLFGKFWN